MATGEIVGQINADDWYEPDAVEKMVKFFKSMDMPSCLADFDLDDSCIERLADLCTFGKQRSVKSYIDMDYDVIKEIFSRFCLGK